jgi:rubrerythrin
MSFGFLSKENATRLHLRSIFALAEELERRAQALYRDLGESVGESPLRESFEFLAKEEGAHAQTIAETLDGWRPIPSSESDPRTIGEDSKKFTDEFFSDPPPLTDTLAVLRYALGQEEKSIAMYEYFQERLSQEFSKDHERYRERDAAGLEWRLSRLDRMIEEERQHKRTIGEFIERRSAG